MGKTFLNYKGTTAQLTLHWFQRVFVSLCRSKELAWQIRLKTQGTTNAHHITFTFLINWRDADFSRKNRGLYITNPDRNNAILRETPHIYHTFCILGSPKLGNLMKKLLMMISKFRIGKKNEKEMTFRQQKKVTLPKILMFIIHPKFNVKCFFLGLPSLFKRQNWRYLKLSLRSNRILDV